MIKILPKPLKKWDTIWVIAPSSTMKTVSKENLTIAEKYFSKFWINVKYWKYCNNDFYWSWWTIEERVEDLMNMFLDEEISCVMPIFWWYTSNQLLPYLDYGIIKSNPKIFIWYSDITALNLAIFTKTWLINYLWMSFSEFWNPTPFEYSIDSFEKLIIKWEKYLNYSQSDIYTEGFWWLWDTNPIKHEWWKSINEWIWKGTIMWWNLSTINLLIWTDFLPNFNNTILFIEECHEFNFWLIDRMLTQIQQSWLLRGIKWMVVWKFYKQSWFQNDKHIEDLLKRITKWLNIPIIYNVNFWHIQPFFTIPIWLECEIDTKISSIKIINW